MTSLAGGAAPRADQVPTVRGSSLVGLQSARYAPVKQFVLDRDARPRGILHGYAAPDRGTKPCRLELVSDGKLISVADACGYSDAARASNLRYGWCRFDLHGLLQVRALGHPAQLRCAISGMVLEAFSARADRGRADSQPNEVPNRSFLSFPGLRAFIGALNGVTTLEQVAPFIEHHRRIRGDRACIGALYSYLHRRPANNTEIDAFLDDMPPDWDVAAAWDKIVSSQEFLQRRHPPMPGVFSLDFPFGLDLLA